MTSTTYDGSTGGDLPSSHPLHGMNDEPPQAHDFTTTERQPAYGANGAHSGANNGGDESSALAQLRERMQRREATPVEYWTREIPGIGLRLVCNPVIEHAEFRRWLKAAQDSGKGKRRRQQQQAGPSDIDQLMLSGLALVHQNVAIEFDTRFEAGGDPNWTELPDPAGGPMTLESQALLREYAVMTPVALLQKFFRLDPRVIAAGQELLDAAGYGDEEDDPEA